MITGGRTEALVRSALHSPDELDIISTILSQNVDRLAVRVDDCDFERHLPG